MANTKPRPRNPKPIRLTERDKAILTTLYAFDGLMARRQIVQLFFGDVDESRARRRLRALFEHGYINQPRPGDEHRAPEWIYWLGREGYRLIAGWNGEEPKTADLKRAKPPKWATLEHSLRVNDVRIAVMLSAESSPELKLTQWISDRTFNRWRDRVSFRGVSGEEDTKAVVPDGFFVVRRPSQKRPGKDEVFAFLLELDMANEHNPRFEMEKVRAGIAYLNSPVYKHRLGVTFGRWLIVTTGNVRMQNLRETTQRAGGSAAFFFTTFEQIEGSPADILTQPIWFMADHDRPQAIIPDSTPLA